MFESVADLESEMSKGLPVECCPVFFPSDGIGDLRTGKEKKKANASYAV